MAICFLSVSACERPTEAVTPQLRGSQNGSTAAGDSDDAAGAQSPSSIAAVEGDFSWPRLLGDDFDGVGVCDGIEFDWARKPEIAWQLPVGDGYGLGSVFDGRYYHADSIFVNRSRVERLRAIDLRDGSEQWSQQRALLYSDTYGYEAGPRSTPTTDGKNLVVFGCDGELSCRNLTDGSLQWSVSTTQEYGVVQNFFGAGSSPLIHDSMVIVPVGGSPPEDQDVPPGRLDRVISNGSALVAFDLETGSEKWKCGDDLASYSSPRTMQIGSKTIVLQFARDHLLAVDPAVGKVLWKLRHRADILESVNAMIPVVDGDRVFISECYQVGSVLLKAAEEGPDILWRDPPKNRRAQAMRCHWSTPILIDGYLYGCSGRNNPDSDFRCIEFSTGEVRWSDDRRVRTSVARAGEHLLVLDEYARMQVVRPDPNGLEVVASYDFSEQLSEPCWAAPILVGNRLLIRGDRNVLCIKLATK